VRLRDTLNDRGVAIGWHPADTSSVPVRSGSSAVPTIRRAGPYRFFFFSNESFEPPHVHVQRGRGAAKFWLNPVALASSRALPAHELRRLVALIEYHHDEFEDAWHEFFGT
jgi:hypothetical protein